MKTSGWMRWTNYIRSDPSTRPLSIRPTHHQDKGPCHHGGRQHCHPAIQHNQSHQFEGPWAAGVLKYAPHESMTKKGQTHMAQQQIPLGQKRQPLYSPRKQRMGERRLRGFHRQKTTKPTHNESDPIKEGRNHISGPSTTSPHGVDM